MPSPILYRVSPASVHEHLFAVEAHFPPSASSLELTLPAWTPGSYLLREYARHVQQFEAHAEEGRPLSVTRLDKATWRIDGAGTSAVTVRYRVYAHDLTVRTSHLDGSHGYFNGATLFVTNERWRNTPCALEVVSPEGWRAFCALPEREGAFLARDFDELVDSPVEMGPHTPLTFEVAGVPHTLVVWGRGNGDRDAFCADLKKICETEVALFGELPVERYLFILHLHDRLRGGLEHCASCTLINPRFGFTKGKAYEDLLVLAAHEYFHLWNVKRIKPRALVPFDYGRENYTRLLWAMEGFTSYYESLIVHRAGLIGAERFLERTAEAFTTLASARGESIQTLEESSLLAWIKHYRPDENSPNSAISYYVKGKAVAVLLDLALREATGGLKSLDDLMRLLMERYGDGSGIPETELESVILELSNGGDAVRKLLEQGLRHAEPLDVSGFETAGLTLSRKPKHADPQGWLGIELKPGVVPVVATTMTDSPASRAGLYADDELVALDGFRLTTASLDDRLKERRAGECILLTIFRREELLTIPLTLGEPPASLCYFERRADASAAQRARYAEWLGESFKEPAHGHA